VTTLMEVLGALVVIIMLARSLWLLVHTTQHAGALSVSHWNHEADRASQRWYGAKVPVRN
jgi:hypothetical protein